MAVETYYVSKTGSDTPPYDTWATASSDISTVLSKSTSFNDVVVIVGDGTYQLSLSLLCEWGVVLKSANGKASTILEDNGAASGGGQLLYINGASIVDGFTIKNGKVILLSFSSLLNCDVIGSPDRGITSEYSTISNCVVKSNSSDLDGAGIQSIGGIIVDCIIEDNVTTGVGGGISTYGNPMNTIQNCIIRNNTATGNGGGIHIGVARDYMTVKNCILYSNTSTTSSGGGVYLDTYGNIVNCTIVDNTSVSGGGLSCTNGGRVINNIIYNNTASSNPNWNNNGTGMVYSNNVTTPSIGVNCIISAPTFVSAGLRDYRLTVDSAGIDNGLDMSSIITDDYYGNPRPLDGNNDDVTVMDIGSFEYLNIISDSDHDTMLDGWEIDNNLNVLIDDSGDDPDNDGQDNATEYVLDNDPSVIDEPFITNLSKSMELSWDTSANRYYSIYQTSDLSINDWEGVPGKTNMVGTGNSMSVVMDNSTDKMFYRVSVHVQ